MNNPTHLEFSEGREHKFYEVIVVDNELMITYGRIGTEGKTQTKLFADAATAQAEAQKKLAEKRKKGYTDAVKGQTEKRPAQTFANVIKPYWERIEATVKPMIQLTQSGSSQSVLESKLGGVPYRVKGEAWPADTEGKPLTFLAQLNFADLPKLEGYPESGILQFFIGKNDFYGSDFLGTDGSIKPNYQVRWIPAPVADLSQLEQQSDDVVQSGEEYNTPFESKFPDGFRLTGKLVKRPMSTRDRLFESVIGLDFLDESDSPDEDLTMGEWLEERYGEFAEEGGHQVGGYPYFTQEDPRQADDPRILLLQIDSDKGIMWGDMGVANFFIHPDDLAKRDFSRVAYNWDCS